MIESFADVYLQVGAVGFCLMLFGFMILNLIRSQKEQSDDLDRIRTDLSKMSAELSNTQNICIKLIDSVNSFKESISDRLERKFDRQDENLEDLSKSIAYLQGKNNGGSK
jgi:septal ring factor EnvC (AmiA/AmiB activator)